MYIWEQPNRPTLSCREADIAAQLAAVRHHQGRLLGRMEALRFKLREEAHLQTLMRDVVKTSEIEGEALDASTVRSSIAHHLGVDIGALKPVNRHVDGIVEVVDLSRNCAAPLTAYYTQKEKRDGITTYSGI